MSHIHFYICHLFVKVDDNYRASLLYRLFETISDTIQTCNALTISKGAINVIFGVFHTLFNHMLTNLDFGV